MILTTSTAKSKIARGEIWLVNFDPQEGQEIRKIRPAVVMNIAAVGRLQLQIVVPITSWQQKFVQDFWMVKLIPTPSNGLANESAADVFQVKSLSVNRFVNKLGLLPPAQLDDIAATIALVVGNNP